LRGEVKGEKPLAAPIQVECSPGGGQAIQAAAKKNLLVLKGGLAQGFREIRLIETAFSTINIIID
jgi:hypothetical protein